METPQDQAAAAMCEALLACIQAKARPGTDPAYPEMPTVAEALRMFQNRPDLAAVLTDQGRLSRDGTLTFPAWGRSSE